jgi:hypothetical protein
MGKQWNGSSVMREFEKIAAESKLIVTDLNPDNKDFVGNPSKTKPVENCRRYEPTEEYDVTKDEGKDLIEKAHPKTIELADSMGSGGVVENILQQQEIGIDIATKMPHGALYGVHAALIQGLVEKANKLENKGKKKEAKRVDETIKRLSSFPFDGNHLIKEALIPQIIGLVSLIPFAWTLVGRAKLPGGGKGQRIPMGRAGKAVSLLGGAFTVLSAFGHKLTSRKEKLSDDIKDLYDILLDGHEKGSSNCKRAADILRPYLNKFSQPLDEKGFKKFIASYELLGPDLKKVERLIARSVLELGPGRWYQTGLDISSRIQEKFNTLSEVYKETAQLISKAQSFGKRVDNTAKKLVSNEDLTISNDISELQKELFGPKSDRVTGKMDMETIRAVDRFERNIQKKLKGIGSKQSIRGKIIQNGKIIIKMPTLRRMLELISTIEKSKEE